MPTYAVRDFSVSELGSLLDTYSHKGEGRSSTKSHLSYFGDYFAAMGTKTIVVEHPYTDKDYTEDYASYYARCHEGYKKDCTRLHFFGTAFDHAMFDGAVAGNDEAIATLKRSYQGFIVVKPLPSTVVGRTCLRTYGNAGRVRSFPVLHTYKAHLCGIELTVDSVPFQEQDTDVAACATSALWSALHCTGLLFQHHIPTPAEITEAAAAHQRPFGRPLPAANGLTYGQMADALRSERLEPLLLKANDLLFLRIAARAYLDARVPCILIGQVGRGLRPNFQVLGAHAMTVTGFSLPASQPEPFGTTGCLFRATAVERLYAHDDQVGPFARLRFEAGSSLLGTSMLDPQTRTRGDINFGPEMLIVPLYHKVRVPIETIVRSVVALDEWLEMARAQGLIHLSDRLVWDVSLSDVSQYKKTIFHLKDVPTDFRLKMLQAVLPRYLWRATAHSGNAMQFELIFDATDLLQGSLFIDGLPHDTTTCKAIGAFSRNLAVQNYIQSVSPRSTFKCALWFADNLLQF